MKRDFQQEMGRRGLWALTGRTLKAYGALGVDRAYASWGPARPTKEFEVSNTGNRSKEGP